MFLEFALLCFGLSHADFTENNVLDKTEKTIEEFAKEATLKISDFFFKSANDSSIKFLLYEKKVEKPIVLQEKNSSIHINLNFDTFIIIHGWADNGSLPWIREAAKRLHQVGSFNIVSVDWEFLASGGYLNAFKNICVVGYKIKNFIKTVNITVNQIHIIGHSLGAQVAAIVAKALADEKLNTIIGLDPAAPLFTWPILSLPEYRLTSDDATFVQIIHTMTFILGVSIPCGTIDFYVNSGLNQPGCLNDTIKNNIYCSHERAHTYYIETIQNPKKFLGTKFCLFDFLPCTPKFAFMGYGVDKNASGVYIVPAPDLGVNSYTQY